MKLVALHALHALVFFIASVYSFDALTFNTTSQGVEPSAHTKIAQSKQPHPSTPSAAQ